MINPLRPSLSVYKMNDCDWWADYTLQDAVKNYSDLVEPDEDNIEPWKLSHGALNKIPFYDEDSKVSRSFREELLSHTQPGFFATTEY